MTNPGGTPSTPSRLLRNSTTKATDHELQKYDNFTRYGHRRTLSEMVFKGDVVTVEKTPERAAAGSNSPLAQLYKRLHQGQVWMLSNHSQNLGCELFEWRNASAARLRSGAVIIPPALHPLDRRCCAHLEAFGRLAPRRARSHGLDNAFPQITRIGLRHRQPPPARRINAQSLHDR